MGKNNQPTYLFEQLTETLKNYVLAGLLSFGILSLVSFYVSYVLVYYVGGILFLATILAPTISTWRPKKRIPIHGKAVLISGCDRGFGHMLAQRLDNIGFHVFAGCLFPEGDGAVKLHKSGSKRMHIFGLDVTNDSSIKKAVRYVEENLGDNALWAVVNNAGILEPGELSWVSMDSIQKTFDVNTFGVIRLTKAFLLKLKECKGRVVTVASIAGRTTSPYIVPYCMSKTAVISFCDGLRNEMYNSNIQVITIEPVIYNTPMFNADELKEKSDLIWTSASNEVKDTYGSDFGEKVFKKVFRRLKNHARHPNEVVSVMEEAVTALYPDYVYGPGDLTMRFASWNAKWLPKPVADLIIYMYTEM